MMNFFLLTILTNILFVAAVFLWIWFIARKNKSVFTEKFATLRGRVDELGSDIVDLEEKILPELKLVLPHVSDLKEHIKIMKEDNEAYYHDTLDGIMKLNEVSTKVKDQHEEYHDGMLEKLNHAGELIVGYETFYENSLLELEELSRFVDILSKRPAVSSDPDFTSFVRAVQVMVQILSKYSAVATELKRENQAAKTD